MPIFIFKFDLKFISKVISSIRIKYYFCELKVIGCACHDNVIFILILIEINIS